jgi:predicted methyltransferase
MINLDKTNKQIKMTLDEFQKIMWEKNSNITKLLSYATASKEYDEILLEFYESKGLKDYQMEISADAITEMPFNKKIDLSFMEQSKTFETNTIPANTYHPVDYMKFDEMGEPYLPLKRFDRTITLPMICDENVGWMSPELFEKTTMQEAVDHAFGNVLVVGLGIGFYPFNILMKEDVKKVTIVERNQDIISLFKKNILPQFPRKEDVEIVQGDALDLLSNDFLITYDYTFVDIWRNEDDGVQILSSVLKCLDLSKELNVDFWIEDAILEQVKDALKGYLLRLYGGTLEKDVASMRKKSKETATFISLEKIHQYFSDKNLKIVNKKQLISFVNDKTILRDLLRSF